MVVLVRWPQEMDREVVVRLLDAKSWRVRVVARKEVTRDEVDAEREVETALAELATERGIDAIEVSYAWGAPMNHYADLPINSCGKAQLVA